MSIPLKFHRQEATTPLNYTVYINQGCLACDDVVSYILSHNLQPDIVDVDRDAQEPPIDLMVYPALFEGERLLAYGDDIKGMLHARYGANTPHPAIAASQELLNGVRTGRPLEKTIEFLAGMDRATLAESLVSDDQRKVFWINLYNAFSHLMLQQNPKVITTFQGRQQHFNKAEIIISGQALSLNDIEHGLIRGSKVWWSRGYINKPVVNTFEREFRVRMPDLRIHFALNCGGASCPMIRFYEVEDINDQLDTATETFLIGDVRYDRETNEASISSLFNWYAGDFGGRKGILRLLRKYSAIPADSNPAIRYNSYSWEPVLNAFSS
ncbi:MAG: DUF547 domain-containing protein [Bacteroidota bacterium]